MDHISESSSSYDDDDDINKWNGYCIDGKTNVKNKNKKIPTCLVFIDYVDDDDDLVSKVHWNILFFFLVSECIHMHVVTSLYW